LINCFRVDLDNTATDAPIPWEKKDKTIYADEYKQIKETKKHQRGGYKIS